MSNELPQDTVTQDEPTKTASETAETHDPTETLSDAAPAETEPAAPAEPAPATDPEPTQPEAASAAEPEPSPTDEFEELSHDDMEQLIEEYTGEAAPSTGEIKTVTVVNITSDGIVVDLGLKQEGLVPLTEFTDDEGNLAVQQGDAFDVLVEASRPAEGYIPCSADGAYRLQLWELVENASREKDKVRCRVTGRVKGGFEVDLLFPITVPGHRPLAGFIPGSQMDLRPVRHWEGFLNRELDAHILRFNRRRGNIVLSRRALLETEAEKRKQLLDEIIVEGATLEGEVKNMTEYGAFIDLGGLDGLLHITDISYRRLTHPSELLHLGEKVTVKVLKVDKKKERVSLGIKQLQPNPWANVAEKYKLGERIKGRVTHLVDYGAFVEVEPGIEGLIHVSEMSWTKKVRHPSQMLNEGDWVEAAVLDVQPKEKRLSLGLRQTEPDPFQEIAQRYPAGSVVDGRVTSLTDFGAFIEVEHGVEGLVHLSELSWNKKPKKPAQLLEKGQELKAKVLKVDILNRRLSLSLKDLTPDPIATFMRAHRVDQVVKGKATRRTDFGVFVELAEGVEGLCHVSELPGDGEEVKTGEQYEFKIIKLNPNERRIGLSLRAMNSVHERRALKAFQDSQPRSTATLAEILSSKGVTPSRK